MMHSDDLSYQRFLLKEQIEGVNESVFTVNFFSKDSLPKRWEVQEINDVGYFPEF